MSIHGPTVWSRSSCAAAAALLAMLLVSSCTEHSALPTWPAIDPDISHDDWRRIYPIVTNEDLNAAWGMDADDMWIVGRRGTILHYDGQTVRSFEPLTTGNLVAIDGCARDEVWTVSSNGEVLRWDGRRWSIVRIPGSSLATVLCLAPDNVYVGGRRWDGGYRFDVWHHDGHRWTPIPIEQDLPYSDVYRIWHPGPGFPVMAAAGNSLFWRDGGAWHQTAAVVRFRDAAQDLVLADDPDSYKRSLYRLDPDGPLAVECEDPLFQVFRSIAISRLPLGLSSNTIWSFDGCRTSRVCDLPFWTRALTVPVLPGSSGLSVFAVGNQCGFARLTWQSDHTLSATMLLSEADNRRVRDLVGNGTDLYFRDSSGSIYRGGSSAWRRVATPFSVGDVKMLASGALAINHSDARIAVLRDDETWHEFPPFGGHIWTLHWWIDEEHRPRILFAHWFTERAELWGLDDNGWTLLVDLNEELGSDSVGANGLAGFGPDDLYIRCRVANRNLLLHHDGHQMRQLHADADLEVSNMEAGPFTQRLYLEGSMASAGNFSGYLKDGAVTILDDRRYWSNLVEVSEDLVFCHTGNRIYQLGAQGWIERAGPADRSYNRIWGHPDQGLFVVSTRDEIYRTDLPPGAR